MSPEDEATENAVAVARIANAMMIAKAGDHRRVSAGLITVASLLVEADLVGRIALAVLLLDAARSLLVNVPSEQIPDHARGLLN